MKSILNNLLIVEDNTFVGECIVDAVSEIKSIGKVRLTASLQEAISFFDDVSYELVILDLKLPDGHGIELLKILREREIKTKVFVFSVSTELKVFCLKYGALAFFDKAKDFDKLIEAIKKV